jgi:hypothetical protein
VSTDHCSQVFAKLRLGNPLNNRLFWLFCVLYNAFTSTVTAHRFVTGPPGRAGACTAPAPTDCSRNLVRPLSG